MPRDLTQEQREEFKHVARVGADLFDLLHRIKDKGLDEGIKDFKKTKETQVPEPDEDDF